MNANGMGMGMGEESGVKGVASETVFVDAQGWFFNAETQRSQR